MAASLPSSTDISVLEVTEQKLVVTAANDGLLVLIKQHILGHVPQPYPMIMKAINVSVMSKRFPEIAAIVGQLRFEGEWVDRIRPWRECCGYEKYCSSCGVEMKIDRHGPCVVTAADVKMDSDPASQNNVHLVSVPSDLPIVVLGEHDVCTMTVVVRVGRAGEAAAAKTTRCCGTRPVPEITPLLKGHRLSAAERDMCKYGVFEETSLDIEDWKPSHPERCIQCGHCESFAIVKTEHVSRELLQVETVGSHLPAHVTIRGIDSLLETIHKYRAHLAQHQ